MYLKTTIYGLCGYNIDYVMLIVGANMGVSTMTREHMRLAYHLRFPVIIVVTKIDICPPDILKNTFIDIKQLVKSFSGFCHLVKGEDDLKSNILNRFMKEKVERLYPIFCVSNKTGEHIGLLKKFLHLLSPLQKFNPDADPVFSVQTVYNPPQVGLVCSGVLQNGTIKKGTILQLGPIFKKFVRVKVWSIHDDFKNKIDQLTAGSSGCLAIKLVNKVDKGLIGRYDIRRGCRILLNPKLSTTFSAQVMIFSQSSITICENYEPILNCMTCVQVAKVLEVRPGAISANPETTVPSENENSEITTPDGQTAGSQIDSTVISNEKKTETGLLKPCLRTKDRGTCIFKFKYMPEYIEAGTIFLFREGSVRGVGKIISIIE